MRALVSVISVTETLEIDGPTGISGAASVEDDVSVAPAEVVSAGSVCATANDTCEYIIAMTINE